MNQEVLDIAMNYGPVAIELVKSGIHRFAEWRKEKKEELSFKIGKTYENYVKKSYNKYSKIKTILYKSEPKFIYEFFETPYLSYGNSVEKTVKLEKADDILSLTKFVIISGRAGIGKTTLMKHLFISAIASKNYIPIFIELKQLNSNECIDEIETIVLSIFNSLSCNIDKEDLEVAFSIGNLLFLFDGYDELNFDKQSEFKKALDTFMDKYDNNAYIISSRPNNEFVGFSRFTNFKAKPFEKEQSKSLIRKIDYDEELKERFIRELDVSLYKNHKSFASNPLLLTIMLMTYENYAEIPSKIHLFYEFAFDTLLSKHDATKSGYKREFKSKIPKDKFRKVFSFFCCCSYMKQQYDFSNEELHDLIERSFNKYSIENVSCDDFIYDLENSICVLYLDGVKYSFLHRSFQEYFTAVFFKDLTDDQLLKCIDIIIKNRSFEDDNVINMFYDMSKDRFEQIVLMHYLEIIDNLADDGCENKCDFYLRYLYTEVEVLNSEYLNYFFDEYGYDYYDNESGEWLGVTFSRFCDFSINFALRMVDAYINRNSIKLDYNDDILINKIKIYYSDKDDFTREPWPCLTMDEILKDESLKELLYNANIGRKTDFMLNLKETIKKSNDFDDIF